MIPLRTGDTVFFVESNRRVRQVRVLSCTGGLYLIRFAEGGGIRVKKHRLFATEEEAERSIRRYKVLKKKVGGHYEL